MGVIGRSGGGRIGRTDFTVALALAMGAALAFTQLSASYFEISHVLGDLWVETDAIWRASLHQAPNRDFISPVGPLFYGIYALLLFFEPPSLHVMVHANLLVGVMAALLAYGISARSAPREAVVLLMLLSFLTAASGRAIGTPLVAEAVAYIVPYNRWCWAIGLPCAIGLLIRHKDRATLPYLLIGLGFAALFYIKLSYFAALAVLAAAAFLMNAGDRRTRSQATYQALVLLGSTLLFLAAGAALFSPLAYLEDVRMVAAANYVVFRVTKFALQLPEAALMFGLALLLHQLASRSMRLDWASAARLLLMVGCGAAIMSQNHEMNEAPFYYGALILAYVLGSRGRCEAPTRERLSFSSHAAFWLMLLSLLGPMTADVGTAVLARARAAAKPLPPIAAFSGTMLAELRSADTREIGKILDGLDLLREVGQSGRTVLPFTMGNPYSALTRTPSPKGAMSIWYYGRTFSEDNLPAPPRALGDADFLLLEKGNPTSEWLGRLYGPVIRAEYRLAGESEHWRVWQRSRGDDPRR